MTALLRLLAPLFLVAAAAHAGGDEMERKLKSAFEAGELSGLHGVLILHQGSTFGEAYFPGEDESWGAPLGLRDHGPETLHDLRSVTKSVTSLLYGAALSEGLVPPVETPLLGAFPEYADLTQGPDAAARAAITIEDALTMRMGLEWDETLPYSDPRNSEIAMETAEDRYRFALSRPIAEPAGTRWRYSGGATALIGRLIEKGVGAPIDVYARKALFAPLGIENFEWARGADGVPSPASGLRLTIRDMAKIGQMMVDGGKGPDGAQIIPADWIEASLTPRAEAEGPRYGYFWWLAPGDGPPIWAAGFGNGGQRLSFNSDLGVVVAIFAGNYNQPDAWRLPVKVIAEFFGPAFEAR